MNERMTRLRAGIFAVLALALLLVMMFFFGLSEIFVKKASAVTYFAESIQGLSVGSEVKYRGVRIGTVKDISIRASDKLIRVDMDIELKSFNGMCESGSADERRLQFRKFIKSEIAQGMRCRLEFLGITGMKYVSFDYFAKPGEAPESPVQLSGRDGVYIPSVSSTFKDILVALTSALDRLSKVQFENLYTQVESVLRELNSTIADPAVRQSLENINRATANIEASSASVKRVLEEKRMENIYQLLTKNLSNFETLTANLNSVTIGMKLPERSADFRAVMANIVELHQELSAAIARFNDTIEVMKRVFEQINNDPGFIFGGSRER